MIITFYASEAKYHYQRILCTSPEMGLTCTPSSRCGYCEDGWTEEPVYEIEPLNLSNRNAKQIMTILGLPSTDEGSIDNSDLDHLKRRIDYLTSDKRSLVHQGGYDELMRYAFDTVDYRDIDLEEDMFGQVVATPIGPRVIDVGMSYEYLVRRLLELRDLFDQAWRSGYSIGWY